MNSKLQLTMFFCSFLFGFVFYYGLIFNYKITMNRNALYKWSISLVYVFDFVLAYLLFLYKMYYGYFHIYFMLFIFLGFIVANCVKGMLRKFNFHLHKK